MFLMLNEKEFSFVTFCTIGGILLLKFGQVKREISPPELAREKRDWIKFPCLNPELTPPSLDFEFGSTICTLSCFVSTTDKSAFFPP